MDSQDILSKYRRVYPKIDQFSFATRLDDLTNSGILKEEDGGIVGDEKTFSKLGVIA
jgi:hypothetical protein